MTFHFMSQTIASVYKFTNTIAKDFHKRYVVDTFQLYDKNQVDRNPCGYATWLPYEGISKILPPTDCS